MIDKKALVLVMISFFVCGVILVMGDSARAEVLLHESFEDSRVGAAPRGWSVGKVGGNKINVAVTDDKASDGEKALLINVGWMTAVHYSVNLTFLAINKKSGKTLISYDLFLETTNDFRLSFREKSTDEIGPYLFIHNNKISVMINNAPHRDKIAYTPNNWYRFTFVIDDFGSQQYKLKIEQLFDGEVHSVLYDEDTLWNFSQSPTKLDQIDIRHRNQTNESKTYIDNIKIETNL